MSSKARKEYIVLETLYVKGYLLYKDRNFNAFEMYGRAGFFLLGGGEQSIICYWGVWGRHSEVASGSPEGMDIVHCVAKILLHVVGMKSRLLSPPQTVIFFPGLTVG